MKPYPQPKEYNENIVLITGNGFDMCHGYHTSYSDFIYYLVNDVLPNEIIKIHDNDIFQPSLVSPSFKESLHYQGGNLQRAENGALLNILRYFKEDRLDRVKMYLSRTNLSDIFKNEFLWRCSLP